MVLTLPDGEVLTHTYDAGGNLQSISGVEGAQGANNSTGGITTNYLQTLLYDKFEQRTYLKLGNGVETHYTYNAQNRRLTNLMSQGGTAGQFQNLNYGYDNVGNILSLQNQIAIPPASGMGGPTSQTFGYDDLYRLTSAKGKFLSSPSKTQNYTLAMSYDDIHNIVGKTQADAITNAGGTAVPQKATSYDWSYVYGGVHPHAPMHIGNRTFGYDANGNQTGWRDDNNGTRRVILWDEDNRISQIDDNGEQSHYTYDAAGERTIKVSRQGQTVYINQYYVVRNRSIVSKHIFAGSSRIATHMEMGNGNSGNVRGGGGSTGGGSGGNGAGQGHANNGNAYGQDQTHGQAGQEHGNSQAANDNGHGNAGSHGKGHADSTDTTVSGGGAEVSLPGNSDQGLENALANGQGHKYGIYKHLEKEGDTVVNGEIVSSAGTGGTTTVSGQSSFTYYYHPDHLGSTGYVTDANGKLYEHIEYFPFGETWVQEHSNTLRTPYLFTGKEFDQETGLYYFGARYYDPRTSVWQSTDPADRFTPKSPSIGLNLYQYALWSPLQFVDPTGLAETGPQMHLTPPCFFCLTTFEGLRRGVSPDEAVARGSLFRNVTAPALITGLAGPFVIAGAGEGGPVVYGITGRAALAYAPGATAFITELSAAELGMGGLTAGALWKMAPVLRGNIIEKLLGQNLPQNFPTIDRFVNGAATSIKSMDLTAKTYQNVKNLTRTVQGYINSVAGFAKNEAVSSSGVRISPQMVNSRVLELAVQKGAMNPEQRAALESLASQAKQQGVDLKVIEIK